MGPVSSKINPILHDPEAKIAGSKFDQDEMHVLKATWQDLADRNNGKGIDKETFLQYFPLNGLLGDRLFAQFDVKGTGLVDFDDFVTGLATVCRGTLDDKIHFLFNMYDVSHDKSVSKQELATLLNQVPKELLINQATMNRNSEVLNMSLHSNNAMMMSNINNGGGGLDFESEVGGTSPTQSPDHFNDGNNNELVGIASDHAVEFEEVDSYTNHDMVERAFDECDLNHEGRLTYEEFKMWIQRNPSIVQHLESILPYSGPKDLQRHHDKSESLPHMKRISSIVKFGSTHSNHHGGSMSGISGGGLSIMGGMGMNHSVSLQDVAGEVFNHSGSFRRSQQTVQNAALARHESFRNRTNTGFSSVGGVDNVMTSPPQLDRMSSANSSNNAVSNTSGASGSQHGGSTFDVLRKGSFSGESVMDPEEQARLYLIQALELTQNEALRTSLVKLLETLPGGRNMVLSSQLNLNGRTVDTDVYHTIVAMEAYLWKKGKAFHMLSKRYYLLSGNCVYYYSHKNDVRPRGVIFLTGSIIERYKDEDMGLKGYYGFELLHQDLSTGEHHRHDQRVLYCKSEEEREKWVSALQHAAHVIPIEEEYVIGKELGRGRFSVVCECVHKITGEHCAVKIIDKNTIEKDEKELLRTEIAVLKLVNHPNIIRMEGIYESKQYIYIVMEMLKGGELFERIVGRPRFSELEAARLLRPLLESVAYLHDLGIVHRDLKPENILCGEELEDIKIADFGLSKMVMPKEKMDAACGTLSYVAPEVLTMQGYGKEADLWSVGVIMFLLLCGKLPFDGDDHNEIIKSTIQADLKVNPAVWAKLSEEVKSLMTSLLNKNPKDRITARDSLKHPFMLLHPNPNAHMSHKQRLVHFEQQSGRLSARGLSISGASARGTHPSVNTTAAGGGVSVVSNTNSASTSSKDSTMALTSGSGASTPTPATPSAAATAAVTAPTPVPQVVLPILLDNSTSTAPTAPAVVVVTPTHSPRQQQSPPQQAITTPPTAATSPRPESPGYTMGVSMTNSTDTNSGTHTPRSSNKDNNNNNNNNNTTTVTTATANEVNGVTAAALLNSDSNSSSQNNLQNM